METLLLCMNGYSDGAHAIVRGMYEKTVTSRYLHSNPDKVDDFLDYFWVAQRRLVNQMKETFGKNILPEDKVAETEANFQAVRKKYEIPACKVCETTRLNHTWIELDFVSMAKAAGAIAQLIVPAYILPTLESHATVRSLIGRVTANEAGALVFDGAPDHDAVDRILMTAQNTILNVLELQELHFELTELHEPLQECFEDFLYIWKTSSEGEISA